MSTMNAFKLNLGGIDYNAVVVNANEGPKKAEAKAIGSRHYVLSIDDSGSMSYVFNRLKQDLFRVFDAIGDEDYVTLIAYSSPGQCRVIFRGARKDPETWKKYMDNFRPVFGATCFSEPLQETLKVIEDLSSICPNFVSFFFTDGLPYVSWGTEEELRRVRVLLAKLAPKVLAINTVGFGNNYDPAFLTELASASQHGQFNHVRNIEDYSVIFKANYERLSELVQESASLSAPGCQVLYLTRNSSKYDATGSMELQTMDKRKNQFVIFKPAADGDFSFTYNGESFTNKSVKAGGVTGATIENIQYAMAYELYYRGTHQFSLDILAQNLADKGLIDGQLVAFTFDEKSAYTEKLRNAVFKHGARQPNSAPANYVPAGDAYCVFDLLTLLSKSESFYIPNFDTYKRIGLKSEDEVKLFKRSKDKPSMGAMDDLVFNRDKLNVSLKFLVEGTVDLDPEAAKAVNLPATVDARTFRNHTLIKDGVVHVEQPRFYLDQAAYSTIEQDNPGLFVSATPITLAGKKGLYYDVVLDLTTIPVVNRTYLAQFPSTADVYKLVREQLDLDAKTKVYNYYIKLLDKTGNKGAAVTLTDEQAAILKAHGVDRSFQYNGVGNKTESREGADSYESRSLEFAIKGCVSLPSVNDVLKKLENPGKGLTPAQAIVASQISAVKALVNLENPDDGDVALLIQEARLVKHETLGTTARLAAFKVATVLTGAWLDNVEASDKGEFMFKAADDNVMLIKAEKELVYFSA